MFSMLLSINQRCTKKTFIDFCTVESRSKGPATNGIPPMTWRTEETRLLFEAILYYYRHHNNNFWPKETTVYIPNHVILYQKKFQGFFGRFSEKKTKCL